MKEFLISATVVLPYDSDSCFRFRRKNGFFQARTKRWCSISGTKPRVTVADADGFILVELAHFIDYSRENYRVRTIRSYPQP